MAGAFDDIWEWKNDTLGKGAKEYWQELYGNQPKTDCFSCGPVGDFIDEASAMTGDVVDLLLPGLRGVFLAAVLAWTIWNGIKMVWFPKEPMTFLKAIPWVALSAVLLGGQSMLSTTDSGLVHQLYSATEYTAGGVSNLILESRLSSQDRNPSYEGLVGLAYNAEKSFSDIFRMCDTVMSSASATNFSPFFMGLILIGVFAVVFLSYIMQVGLSVVRLQFAAFSMPFVVMMMAFPTGKATLKKLATTLLGAIVALAFATFAFAIVMVVIQNLDLGDTHRMTTLTWTDHRIWLPLTVGVLGGAIIYESVSMANSLVGSSFDNAAAMMGIGAMGAAGGAALMAANMGRGAAGSMAGGFLDAQQNPRVQAIMDRITGGSKPPFDPGAGKAPNGYGGMMSSPTNYAKK